MVTTTLLVDGMLSGTGLRDAVDGGYIEPVSLGVSAGLADALADWVSNYGQAHLEGYNDADAVTSLDGQGMALVARLASERPDHTVGYYSSALMRRLDHWPHA